MQLEESEQLAQYGWHVLQVDPSANVPDGHVL